jgi:hypothetical protein
VGSNQSLLTIDARGVLLQEGQVDGRDSLRLVAYEVSFANAISSNS